MTTKAWWDDYVGLPYAEKGRTRDGTDCWGLVRMVHAEHFGNTLPMLEGNYDNSKDDAHLAELIAREQEQWQQVELPREGDVVLFHVLGLLHVGVVTAPGRFLHIRSKELSTIESLESPLWKKRFRGFYRYCTETTPIAYSAAAHPLRSQRIEGMLPPGASISKIIEILKERQGVSPEMPFDANIWLNGRAVERGMWDYTIPGPGSRIEMRSVARGTGSGSGDGRAVAGIIVMVLATVLAPYLAPVFSGIAGSIAGVGTAAAGSLATSLAFVAVSVAGNLLVNAIFPVRQPDDPGQAERQLLLQGGANRPLPYGTVPVVLGQFRFVAPCAANTYVESNTTTSYLRMAVCWGVGPLQIADLGIGAVPLASYEEVQVENLTGLAGENKARFNAIYGKDVSQIDPQILLLCPELKVSSVTYNSDVLTVVTQGPHGYSTNALVKVTDDFDSYSPSYGQLQVRTIEEGAITVTGPNSFTLPRTKIGVGPLITASSYTIGGDSYTASVPADWSLYDRNSNPENPSSAGATHNPAAATPSRITFNSFATTATHTYEIRFYVDAGFLGVIGGTGFQAYAGGAVGPFVTTVGWHTQTIVAVDNTGVGVNAAANTSGVVLFVEARRVYTGGVGFVGGGNTSLGSSYSEYVVNAETDQLKVTLHFPSGLRSVVKEGGNAGQVDAALFRGIVQYRQLDSNTLAPITPWGDFDKKVASRVINLAPAWFNVDNDAALEKVYQWTRFTVDEYGHIITRTGAMTTSQFANPTGNLLLRLQQANFGVDVVFERLPVVPAGEEHLYDICVFGDAIVTTTDLRDASVTGCAASAVGRAVTIATGTLSRADTENIRLGGENEPFYERKDAFTHNITMDVTRGKYEVRIRRTSASNNLFQYPSGNEADRLSDCYLQSITAYSTERPITPPVPMAMTALRIKATNQINGNIEGLSATVTSICLDYDHLTTTWVSRPTRNPASLLRYVLQHPANIKRVADSKLDLPSFVEFHNYCRTNGFVYDGLLSEKRSVWDVMMDIAAAGRASPTQKDGKHSVLIDKERTSIVQHFTPHNSWGFQSTRALPKHPHAFRVSFNNAQKAYQPDERIVYNDGYSDANATLFEELSLPGVTVPTTIFKHARFHFAQLKLRPEQYTLNVDIENLVATRGDLVRVVHDVPMWGLGSGRIKNRVSGTVLELDEAVLMDAGVQYSIRIRLADGTSLTRTVAAAVADGLYTTITLTASVTVSQGEPGNLFLFGALNAESVELVVQSIEPAENLSARLTLVDYSPDIYDSDLEVVPPWDSQITLPPNLVQRTIRQKPVITLMRSDEAIMLRNPDGSFNYGLKVSWRNPATLPERVNGVQAEIDYAGDGRERWYGVQGVPMKQRHVEFRDLREGRKYKVRLRYVDEDGRAGPWVVSDVHKVVGKTTAPKQVTNFTAAVDESGTAIELKWDGNDEIDIKGYEIRAANTNWGKDTGYIYRGLATRKVVQAPKVVGASKTWYIRAFDRAGLYGKVVTQVTFTKAALPTPTGLTAVVTPSSTTVDRVTYNWNDMVPEFALKHYEAVLTLPGGGGTRTYKGRTSEWTTPMNWVGLATLAVKVVDVHDSLSPAASVGLTKTVPNNVGVVTVTVNGLRLIANWDNVAISTLPIAGYEIRTANTGWGNATPLWRGTASAYAIAGETLAVGLNTFYIKAFDTDGQYSTAATVFTYTRVVPTTPVITTPVFTDTASTDATVTFNWNDSSSAWGIDYYTVTLTLPSAVVRTMRVKGSEWTTRANWSGNSTLRVKAHDRLGSQSAEASLVVAKSAPATVGALAKAVDRRRITIDWAAVAKTTLPVAGYEMRSVDSGFGTTGFLYRGPATIVRSILMALGTNNFYVRAYDTDGVYSAASSTISHVYAVPPNLTTVTATRRNRLLNFTTTGPATPADFSHYAFRIKLGGAGGDVWAAYDVEVKSQFPFYEGWTPTALGTYNISARMVDTDGNVSAASVNTAITVTQIPAP